MQDQRHQDKKKIQGTSSQKQNIYELTTGLKSG